MSYLWTIEFVNQSTLATDADVDAYLNAQQIQIDADFAPVWGVGANVVRVTEPTPGHITMFLLDDPTIPGAFGYHDITQAGVPVGFVFLKISQQENSPWQITASHETLELLADPFISNGWETTVVPGPKAHKKPFDAWFAIEVCDPVENDTYNVNGIPMSNFVWPSWFESLGITPKPTQFDHMSTLKRQLWITPGGYMSYQKVIGKWQQLYGRHARPDPKSPRSRRHRFEFSRFVRRFGEEYTMRTFGGPIIRLPK